MAMIHEQFSDRILELRMNFGEGNTFTPQAFEALDAALSQAQARTDIRVLILTSDLPDAFSNGLNPNSVHGASAADIEKLIGFFFSVLRKIYQFPVPVISAINGHAIGYGAMLALVSDFRLLVDKGARMSYPELNIGISLPVFITLLLQDLVGVRTTRDLLYTGLAPKPPEALALGLADELVEKKNSWTAHALWQRNLQHCRRGLCGFKKKSRVTVWTQELRLCWNGTSRPQEVFLLRMKQKRVSRLWWRSGDRNLTD
jgi:enoyl-CoA hydratase/carnithine racemase